MLSSMYIRKYFIHTFALIDIFRSLKHLNERNIIENDYRKVNTINRNIGFFKGIIYTMSMIEGKRVPNVVICPSSSWNSLFVEWPHRDAPVATFA